MLLSVSTGSFVSLLFLSVLFPTHGTDIGDVCPVNSYSSEQGVCRVLEDCPVVYNDLLAGNVPEKTCGFLGFTPVVCCPESGQTTITTPSPTQPQQTIKITTTTITTQPPTQPPTQPQQTTIKITTTTHRNKIQPDIESLDNNRGAVARLKCAENAEAVYGLEIPPTLTIMRVPVNVSRCSLKTRRLIVGGKKADPKEFPHMTAIGFESRENNIQWFCGGTLISARIVLTAAHCTYHTNLGAAKWARVGDLNLVETNDDARPQTLRIIERIRHPNYKKPSEYHDIAILKLEKEVIFNAWVRPACLPVDLPDVGTDNKAVATGWGLVDWYDDAGSDNLLKVTLKLIPHHSCNASFSDSGTTAQLRLGIVNDWQICAGEIGKDTCQGDSGGPLAVFNTVHECMYNVIGITSLGRYCGSITPGVYTRVYNYIPWIERTAWPEYFQ